MNKLTYSDSPFFSNWSQTYFTNLTLSKEELCLISIALNEYQMETDNYHLDEMRKVSSKIDNHYKQLITQEV